MRAPPAVNDIAQADLWARPPAELAPHHHGHRERLRARAARGGPGALPDYEMLELLLFRLIPRSDTKPVAKALLARFGTLAEVLGAPERLLCEVKGVGPAVALDLKIIAAEPPAATQNGRLALGKAAHRTAKREKIAQR